MAPKRRRVKKTNLDMDRTMNGGVVIVEVGDIMGGGGDELCPSTALLDDCTSTLVESSSIGCRACSSFCKGSVREKLRTSF
jgi:hypothetical protein